MIRKELSKQHYQVYGESLKHYSASEKRSERPGIDIRLYNGLHGMFTHYSTNYQILKI